LSEKISEAPLPCPLRCKATEAREAKLFSPLASVALQRKGQGKGKYILGVYLSFPLASVALQRKVDKLIPVCQPEHIVFWGLGSLVTK